jgi:hypothetical protein
MKLDRRLVPLCIVAAATLAGLAAHASQGHAATNRAATSPLVAGLKSAQLEKARVAVTARMTRRRR